MLPLDLRAIAEVLAGRGSRVTSGESSGTSRCARTAARALHEVGEVRVAELRERVVADVRARARVRLRSLATVKSQAR